MRVRVDVAADTPRLRWEDVHGAARAVVYGLLGEVDPELARTLHDDGWRGSPLKPVGVGAPRFAKAPKKKGEYTTSSDGSVWFGSPVPEIASALVAALASRRDILWGGTRLRIRGFTVDFAAPPAHDGPVELTTTAPVVLKHEGRDLLPGDEHYVERLRHNLAHKADFLGLPAPRNLAVLESGPRRRFAVSGAPRIGAWVRVSMEADPAFVEALRSWGIGLGTLQGFGWIR